MLCQICFTTAPARAYIPELLDDILKGHINPGRIFDFSVDLSGITEAYAAMDERRAIKSLVKL
jgi:Zn-dependent alcohol dehydrogenase